MAFGIHCMLLSSGKCPASMGTPATAIILENMTVGVNITPEIPHTGFQPDALAPGKSSNGDSVRELVT